jgi:hypothetical protein
LAWSMAVYCQTLTFVPESLPTWKQSKPTSSPGRSTSICLGAGRGGVAGHEREARDPSTQPMPTRDPPDPVVADDDAAPALLGQAGY